MGVNEARAHELSLLQGGAKYCIQWVPSQVIQPSRQTGSGLSGNCTSIQKYTISCSAERYRDLVYCDLEP